MTLINDKARPARRLAILVAIGFCIQVSNLIAYKLLYNTPYLYNMLGYGEYYRSIAPFINIHNIHDKYLETNIATYFFIFYIGIAIAIIPILFRISPNRL